MFTAYSARLAVTFAQNLNRPRIGPLDEVRLPMRVWPHDIDIYLHLNNGRYLTLMDNGRLQLLQRSGLLELCRRNGWKPVLGAATIDFKRELKPFQSFELVTRIVHWDEKWFFIEHRLENAGTVHAHACVKAVFKQGRRTVAPAEILRDMGHHGPAPEPPEALATWIGQRPASARSPMSATAG